METNLDENELNNIGVYILHNNNTGEAYVGSGILKDRKYEHERRLLKGSHCNYKLQKSFNKNQSFDFIASVVPGETIEESRKNALELEQMLLTEHSGNSLLLNIAKEALAPMAGRKHSEESLQRMRDIQSKKTLSEEHKRKIGESNKISHANQETREKMRQFRLGKESSSETREKISKSLKEKYKNGYVHPFIQTPMTEEHKRKLREANAKIVYTEEIRERMSKAHIKPVTIDNVSYASTQEAASHLNLPKTTVAGRIRSDSYPSYHFTNKK